MPLDSNPPHCSLLTAASSNPVPRRRDSGHADRYAPKLTVNYVNHHNPDLILFDSEGDELQRIDLTRLRTTQNIHKLINSTDRNKPPS